MPEPEGEVLENRFEARRSVWLGGFHQLTNR